MFALLESTSECWNQWMMRSLVQGSLAFLLACVIWVTVRRFAPPEFGCRLFLLVIIGLAIPLSISAPSSIAERVPWQIHEAPSLPVSTEGVTSSNNADEPTPPPSSATPNASEEPVTSPAILSETTKTSWPWSLLLMLTWACLVAAGAVHLWWQQRQVSRLVRSAEPVNPEDLPFDFAKLKADARVSQSVGLFLCQSMIESPAVCGLLRPKVLLPPELLGKLSPDQLRWTIAHELAHVRRGDLFLLPFQQLVRLLFFFHPVVWLTHWIVAEFREHACDDEASTVSGVRSKTSCEAFLNILEAAGGTPRARFGLVGFSTPVGPIQRRLMRMMKRRPGSAHRLSVGYQAAIVVAGAIMLTHVRGRPAPNHANAADLAPQIGTIVLSPASPSGESTGILVTPASYSVAFQPTQGTRHEFRSGVQDYRVIAIDTREFPGPACLTLDVTVQNEEGTLGSFDLFPGHVPIPADGAAQETLRDNRSLGFAYDVHPTRPKTIATYLPKGAQFQLGASGSWGAEVGSRSQFQVQARIDANYALLPTHPVRLTESQKTASFSDPLPAHGYRSYLVETTGFGKDDMLIIHVTFSESAGRGRLDIFDPSLRIPRDPSFHRSVSTHARNKLSEYSLVRGERIERRQDYIAVPLHSLKGGRVRAAVAKSWGAPEREGNCEIRFQVRPLEAH